MPEQSSTLVKALIEVLDNEGNRKDEPEEIPVMFNPTEYSLDKQLNIDQKERPGRTAPTEQFVSGNAESLSTEFLFDTMESGGDVRKTYTDRIDSLLVADQSQNPPEPPKCRFVWGSLIFKGRLKSAKKTFTMFDRDGVPVRAKVQVTFEGSRILEEESSAAQEQSGDGTRSHTVTEGDTLWDIAGAEYGDPQQWRRIADANGVENPRTLQVGTVLEIPPAEGA
jgi:nucleoid-associated protein YgaU